MNAERTSSPDNKDEFSKILFLLNEVFERKGVNNANSIRIGGLIHVMYENLNRHPKLHLNQVEEAAELLSGIKERVRKALASPIYWKLSKIEAMLASREQIRVV